MLVLLNAQSMQSVIFLLYFLCFSDDPDPEGQGFCQAGFSVDFTKVRASNGKKITQLKRKKKITRHTKPRPHAATHLAPSPPRCAPLPHAGDL